MGIRGEEGSCGRGCECCIRWGWHHIRDWKMDHLGMRRGDRRVWLVDSEKYIQHYMYCTASTNDSYKDFTPEVFAYARIALASAR